MDSAEVISGRGSGKLTATDVGGAGGGWKLFKNYPKKNPNIQNQCVCQLLCIELTIPLFFSSSATSSCMKGRDELKGTMAPFGSLLGLLLGWLIIMRVFGGALKREVGFELSFLSDTVQAGGSPLLLFHVNSCLCIWFLALMLTRLLSEKSPGSFKRPNAIIPQTRHGQKGPVPQW